MILIIQKNADYEKRNHCCHADGFDKNAISGIIMSYISEGCVRI